MPLRHHRAALRSPAHRARAQSVPRRAAPLLLASGTGSRRTLLAWLATAALLAVALGSTLHLQRRAAGAVASYGERVPVWVSTRSLRPGEPVTAGDVARRDLPRAVLPAAAAATEVVGRTVASPILAGEVVLADRLAEAGRDGTSALLADGTVGLAVAVDRAAPGLRTGDAVVIVVADVSVSGAIVAGTVVGAGEDALVIAVPLARAALVAAALLRDEAVVGAVSPPRRPTG